MKVKNSHPNQIEIVFTWSAKIIISMKQLMKKALEFTKTSSVYDGDSDKYRKTTIKENVAFLFRQYRNWKRGFVKTGEAGEIPDFVYFQ